MVRCPARSHAGRAHPGHVCRVEPDREGPCVGLRTGWRSIGLRGSPPHRVVAAVAGGQPVAVRGSLALWQTRRLDRRGAAGRASLLSDTDPRRALAGVASTHVDGDQDIC